MAFHYAVPARHDCRPGLHAQPRSQREEPRELLRSARDDHPHLFIEPEVLRAALHIQQALYTLFCLQFLRRRRSTVLPRSHLLPYRPCPGRRHRILLQQLLFLFREGPFHRMDRHLLRVPRRLRLHYLRHLPHHAPADYQGVHPARTEAFQNPVRTGLPQEPAQSALPIQHAQQHLCTDFH